MLDIAYIKIKVVLRTFPPKYFWQLDFPRKCFDVLFKYIDFSGYYKLQNYSKLLYDITTLVVYVLLAKALNSLVRFSRPNI